MSNVGNKTAIVLKRKVICSEINRKVIWLNI